MNYPTEADYIEVFGELSEEAGGAEETETTEETVDTETATETEETTAEETVEAEEAESTEEVAQETTVEQSAEERHRQAAARRAREAQAAAVAAQARVDEVYAEIFKDQINPFTGKPITTEAEYRAYQQMKAQQSNNAALQKAGIDPKMIQQMVQQELQPMQQELQKAKMREAQTVAAEYNRKAEEAMKKAVENIGTMYDPTVKTMEDIAAMPTAAKFKDLVQKGVGLEDAFYLANREAIDKRRAQAAYRKGADAKANRQHLAPAPTAQRGKDPVSVPADVARIYREAMPDMTDAEMVKAYEKFLGAIKS